MTTLTADANMLAILSQAKELAEVRDANGKVIGFYAPTTIKDAHAYANAAAHINPADVQRAKKENGPGRSTAEVLERLKSLEKT